MTTNEDLRRIFGEPDKDYGVSFIVWENKGFVRVESAFLCDPGCARAITRMREVLKKERKVEFIDVEIV